VVPDDHQVRAISAVLDLSWVYGELSAHYPALGRPSIDPVLMIRMLIIGYGFGLRSGRLLCRGQGQSGVPLVLRLEHRRQDSGPFGLFLSGEGGQRKGNLWAEMYGR
jgi:Transposase domain (DUF772)